jgi:vacuolar-type H+-ATPase subunit F/Vma7
LKKKIAVAGSHDDIMGFRLAGIKKTVKPGSPEFQELASQGDWVILMTSEAMASADVSELMKNNIIQEIPSGIEDSGRVRKIIRDTMGFELK